MRLVATRRGAAAPPGRGGAARAAGAALRPLRAASAGAAGAPAGRRRDGGAGGVGGIGGRGGHLRGPGRARGGSGISSSVQCQPSRFRNRSVRPPAALGWNARNGACGQLSMRAAVEVVVVDLEAGVARRAAQEHDAVVVDPRRVVDRIVAGGQRRQQAAVARVEHARCETAGRRSASRRPACRRARRAGWRCRRRAARARSRAPRRSRCRARRDRGGRRRRARTRSGAPSGLSDPPRPRRSRCTTDSVPASTS